MLYAPSGRGPPDEVKVIVWEKWLRRVLSIFVLEDFAHCPEDSLEKQELGQAPHSTSV